MEWAFEFFVRICISDEIHTTFSSHCICIFYQLITSHFRWNAINPTKHNTQSHLTSNEMQSTQPNITHNHILPTKYNTSSHHTSDEMQLTQPNITHNHILPITRNTQSHHISDEIQLTKHNTYSHLHLKMYEQWSHFVVDAHFERDQIRPHFTITYTHTHTHTHIYIYIEGSFVMLILIFVCICVSNIMWTFLWQRCVYITFQIRCN